ncbi:hypothetical protein GCM10027290_26660 [Micromonospora sonneratiae]|uniref:Uncharacterized protein n=1 Tax=Micromonospora sonneratiae TaxID=1184706 RepID=A0ABW3YB80_9ACTN
MVRTENTNAVRAEALFASMLQRSDVPSPAQVRAAVGATLRRYGVRGCAARVAQEYGDHPAGAVQRMCWVLAELRAAYPTPVLQRFRRSLTTRDAWR